MLNPYTIAGTVLAIVALAGGWRAWLLQYRADVSDTDTRLRAAGHVPPETASEITAVIAPIRDTGAKGAYYGLLLQPYEGRHRARSGCLTVAALQARLGVAR